jgi:hypothetical protein
MKHPLFKPTDTQLSPQEEQEIIHDIAKAYRQKELDEKKPEFQRIAGTIKEMLDQDASCRKKDT